MTTVQSLSRISFLINNQGACPPGPLHSGCSMQELRKQVHPCMCKSQLSSPKACGALPNRGMAFLSVRTMLNFFSLSSARNLCHSYSVMPSELLMPFFSKGPKFSLLFRCLPYSTQRYPSRITGQSIENGSSREMIFASLPLKLVMAYFKCTLESHLQTSWNMTRL